MTVNGLMDWFQRIYIYTSLVMFDPFTTMVAHKLGTVILECIWSNFRHSSAC